MVFIGAILRGPCLWQYWISNFLFVISWHVLDTASYRIDNLSSPQDKLSLIRWTLMIFTDCTAQVGAVLDSERKRQPSKAMLLVDELGQYCIESIPTQLSSVYYAC